MKMKNIVVSALLFILPSMAFSQWTGATASTVSTGPKTMKTSGGLENWRHSNVGIGINQYSSLLVGGLLLPFDASQANFGLSASSGKKWYLGRWASDRIGLGLSFDWANFDFAFGEDLVMMQFGQAIGLNLSINLTNSVYLDFNSHFLGYEVGFGSVTDNIVIHGGYFSQYNPIIRFNNFYVGPALHFGFGGYNLLEYENGGDYARMAVLLKIGFVKF